jgi:hypothetical protein
MFWGLSADFNISFTLKPGSYFNLRAVVVARDVSRLSEISLDIGI